MAFDFENIKTTDDEPSILRENHTILIIFELRSRFQYITMPQFYNFLSSLSDNIILSNKSPGESIGLDVDLWKIVKKHKNDHKKYVYDFFPAITITYYFNYMHIMQLQKHLIKLCEHIEELSSSYYNAFYIYNKIIIISRKEDDIYNHINFDILSNLPYNIQFCNFHFKHATCLTKYNHNVMTVILTNCIIDKLTAISENNLVAHTSIIQQCNICNEL